MCYRKVIELKLSIVSVNFTSIVLIIKLLLLSVQKD